MVKRILLSLLLVLGFPLLITPALGDLSPALKKRIGTPPFKVFREILATNLVKEPVLRQEGSEKPPYLTWLADSDPRLSSSDVLPGGKRMIAVRNPGGQLAVSPGSLNYGIHLLHTPVLLISGVSDSRHIKFYLQGYGDLDPFLRLDLDHLHPALAGEAGITLDQENPEEKLLRLVEANVDYQVEQALNNYRERVREGRLVVIGSVFDTTNHYGRGDNKLIITNVNGSKGEKLEEMRLVRQLAPDLRIYVAPQE